MLLRPTRRPPLSIRFCGTPTLSMICDVVDPVLQQPYSRDPRYVARKAENYLRQTGICDDLLCRAGTGVLHLRLDPLSARTSTAATTMSNRPRATGTRGRDEGAYGGGNLGYKQRYKEGFSRSRPTTRCRKFARRSR